MITKAYFLFRDPGSGQDPLINFLPHFCHLEVEDIHFELLNRNVIIIFFERCEGVVEWSVGVN